MFPEQAAQMILPHILYALALSLFALLMLNLFFPTKRKHSAKKPQRR